MHPSDNQENRLPLMKISYALIAVGFLIFIMVGGSLWIIFDLYNRMMT